MTCTLSRSMCVCVCVCVHILKVPDGEVLGCPPRVLVGGRTPGTSDHLCLLLLGRQTSVWPPVSLPHLEVGSLPQTDRESALGVSNTTEAPPCPCPVPPGLVYARSSCQGFRPSQSDSVTHPVISRCLFSALTDVS